MMPQLRSLLKSVKVEVARGRRSCGHNRAHKILKGEKCLAFKGMQNPKSYCQQCAKAMISEAQRELQEMTGDLGLCLPMCEQPAEGRRGE